MSRRVLLHPATSRPAASCCILPRPAASRRVPPCPAVSRAQLVDLVPRTSLTHMEQALERPQLGFCKHFHKTPTFQSAIAKVCHTRALKRWSALLTANKSRIGFHGGMRKRLGEEQWTAFVKFAEIEYKPMFLRALQPIDGMIHCSGTLEGSPCPHDICINLNEVDSIELGERLAGLHLDHSYDVKHICNVWSHALPDKPCSWDDGLCGHLIGHLLFGTEDHILSACSKRKVWCKQVHLRCGNVRGKKGVQQVSDFCHNVGHAHYSHVLTVSDIKWPA